MRYITEIKDKNASMNTCTTMGTLQVGNWYTFGRTRGMYLGSVLGKPVYAYGTRRNDKAHALRNFVLECEWAHVAHKYEARRHWKRTVEIYRFEDLLMDDFFA